MENRNEADIIARLDKELLSIDFDAASLEYFSHAAFDERIEALLDNADIREIKTTLEGYTPQTILDGEFGPNDLAANVPISHFSIDAQESREGDTFKYSFDISSIGESQDQLQFRLNERGSYDVYSQGTDSLLNLTPYEAALLVFRVMDMPAAPLEGLSNLFGDHVNEYHGFIRKVIRIGAEAHEGKIVTDHYIQRKMTDDVRHADAEVRLGYRQIETSDHSEIVLKLEKAFVYPELESEEVYSLEILYTSEPLLDDLDEHEDKDALPAKKTDERAERSIRGDGGLSVKSIKLIHTDQGGKKTPLDTTDPTVMQDFIEAYEVLLQDAA